jgi:hypothetical protein
MTASGQNVPDRELLDEFARQLLSETAPEELAIFDETADEYYRDPEGVLSASGRDEAVGFGLDIALLTPYVLAIAGSVLTFLVDTFVDAAKNESKPVVADLVRRLFRRGRQDAKAPEKAAPVALSATQVEKVRELALARARDLKLPDNKARLLADAIVGGLNVAT